MAGLDRHAELVELSLGLMHERKDAVRNDAEVLVLKFLALWRLGAEQRAAGRHEVGARKVEIAVDEEVFLLRTGGGGDHRDVGVAEKLQDAASLNIERLHRAENRGLEIERLTRPRNERGRDAQRDAVAFSVR